MGAPSKGFERHPAFHSCSTRDDARLDLTCSADSLFPGHVRALDASDPETSTVTE